MDMSWFEFLTVVVLILSVMAAILCLLKRSVGYAALFGLLFIVAAFAVMNGPLGDQIRKEKPEDKAAASQVSRPW
jgi:hypothetical protein